MITKTSLFILLSLEFILSPIYAFARPYNQNFDDPENLSDRRNQFRTSISDLSDEGLFSKSLGMTPWSDGHWPMESGLIAGRYNDKYYSKLSRFDEKKKYILSINPISKLSNVESSPQINFYIERLSPSEKYDLLIGDYDGGLTKSIWAKAEEFRGHGELDSWIGICDGSAAASVYVEEPVSPVVLKTPDGKHNIKFFARDIKGLESLLYSNFGQERHIVGTKSGSFQEGLTQDESQFDNNPATFHLALLNVFNRENKPLFLDKDKSKMVWNSSLLSYKLEYFNAKTGKPTLKYEEAIQEITDKLRKKARERLSENAKFWLVVRGNVTVGLGEDSSLNGHTKVSLYNHEVKYTLELDEDLTILGGEWLSTWHPDMMWGLAGQKKPWVLSDKLLTEKGESWDGVTPIPFSWLNLLKISSQAMRPSAIILNKLVERSKVKDGTPVDQPLDR